jgi:hypothetical protein
MAQSRRSFGLDFRSGSLFRGRLIGLRRALVAAALGLGAFHPIFAQVAQQVTVVCSSKPGERQHCAADTSQGVALLRSTGEAPCLLGKSWGYDDKGVWVSDGCSAQFVVGKKLEEAAPAEAVTKSPAYIPNAGFRLISGEKGEIYIRLFTYARYLNQNSLDGTYQDFFGNDHEIDRRQDVQRQKFFLPFSGWFLTPKFRYYLYVWSSNASQGDPAQVVGAGNISYTFNRYATLGGGITSLPSTRSTEGQFPYWLGVDDRLTSDEFFRGSYTSGIWVKGEFSTRFKYMAMLANNLSTLGVSAAQIDNNLDTTSLMLAWLPTTGEFGLWGTYGDYDDHQQVATRLGVHFTQSREEKQSQPGTDDIENSQIRLTDGSVIFTDNLFGPGIRVDDVRYRMSSLDGGIKYRGFSLEAEYYWRWLDSFHGANVEGLDQIYDTGFQIQTSGMIIKKTLQAYVSGSAIYGDYAKPTEIRAGVNWYIVKERGLRANAEWIHVNHSPVGYTAYPLPVGASGDAYHVNFEMNF